MTVKKITSNLKELVFSSRYEKAHMSQYLWWKTQKRCCTLFSGWQFHWIKPQSVTMSMYYFHSWTIYAWVMELTSVGRGECKAELLSDFVASEGISGVLTTELTE